SRVAGDAAGHGVFPDRADEISRPGATGAVRLSNQGIVDQRSLRVSSDARSAGLRRISEEEVSRDVRARRVRSIERKPRFACGYDGSVRRSRGRSTRTGETLGRKDSGQSELRSGNLQSLPESEVALNDARPARVARRADRA